MRGENRAGREAKGKHSRVFFVEGGDSIRSKARGDASASADSAAPGFVRVGDVKVEREGLDPGEPADRDIASKPRMHPEAASELPGGVVGHDQCLRGLHNVSGQRQPVKAADDEAATWDEDPASLRGRARWVEPVPALAGGGDIERGRWLSGFFGGGDTVVNADSGLDIENPCLMELRFSDVERSDGAASLGELASDGTGAGSEVEAALTGEPNAEGGSEALEELWGEAGTMTGIVCCGLAEVRTTGADER